MKRALLPAMALGFFANSAAAQRSPEPHASIDNSIAFVVDQVRSGLTVDGIVDHGIVSHMLHMHNFTPGMQTTNTMDGWDERHRGRFTLYAISHEEAYAVATKIYENHRFNFVNSSPYAHI